MQNLALLNKSEIFDESFDVLRLAHSCRKVKMKATFYGIMFIGYRIEVTFKVI